MRRRSSIWLLLSFAALALTSWVSKASTLDPPVVLTNTFASMPGQFGTIVTGQTIGGHAPGSDQPLVELLEMPPGIIRLGETNQWRFYVITNEYGFTNAAFILFDPRQAMRPVPFTNPPPASADLDLYVSSDALLVELDPGSFAAARKSLQPGMDELVQETDAQQSAYYIAVKCETSEAEFGLAAVFSELPFSETDTNGDVLLHAVPAPIAIPSGSVSSPGQALSFVIPPTLVTPRRLTVSTTISHSSAGDLQISLHHGGRALLLRDFSTGGAVTNQVLTFDDSLEGDLPGSLPSAGPGDLGQFAGSGIRLPWMLRFNNRSSVATLHEASIALHVQQLAETGITGSVLAGGCRDEFVHVQPGITNMAVAVALESGLGPLAVSLNPANQIGPGFNTVELKSSQPEAVLQVTPWSNPPISPGLWRLRLCNTGTDPISLTVTSSFQGTLSEDQIVRGRFGNSQPIADAALSSYTLMVTNTGWVHSIQAGLRLDHPRVSDLELSLVSPQGTRVLLDAHRGGLSTNGMGHNILLTNVYPVSSSGGPAASVNRINLTKTSGVITINYEFYALPDSMRIYYESNLIFDSDLIADSGTTNVAYGPGEASYLTIIMNEGDNPDPDTAWFYTVTSIAPDFAFLTLADGALPMKFAPDPFDFAPDGDYFSFLRGPEQPLAAFAGETVTGAWRLDVRDTYPGPGQPSATLVKCELSFILRPVTPMPIALTEDDPLNGSLAPAQVQWFKIHVLPWTAAATNILMASMPLALVFSPAPDSWVASQVLDTSVLLANCNACASILTPSGMPALVPDSYYYLGLVNTNMDTVTYSLRVELGPKVVFLVNGASVAQPLSTPGQNDYYHFAISDRARRAQFRISDATGDMVLFLKKNLPLPTPANAQAFSDNAGTSDELITLRQDAGPVLLSAGSWYLCASNASGTTVSYTVAAHSWISTGIPLLITNQLSVGAELCLTWASLPGLMYHIEATPDFEIPWSPVSAAITAEDDFTSYCFPMSEPSQFFRIHEGAP